MIRTDAGFSGYFMVVRVFWKGIISFSLYTHKAFLPHNNSYPTIKKTRTPHINKKILLPFFFFPSQHNSYTLFISSPANLHQLFTR
ncbi:uncharacterized protein VTP21DRAFT_5709 [Calcarisporiella thermophila]|uniref:uncharacterized protein n=1 Tax=Calcarisporiella thermophila TaxID=911321 RepID=UPI003742E0F9